MHRIFMKYSNFVAHAEGAAAAAQKLFFVWDLFCFFQYLNLGNGTLWTIAQRRRHYCLRHYFEDLKKNGPIFFLKDIKSDIFNTYFVVEKGIFIKIKNKLTRHKFQQFFFFK